jgi:hypothetical protein
VVLQTSRPHFFTPFHPIHVCVCYNYLKPPLSSHLLFNKCPFLFACEPWLAYEPLLSTQSLNPCNQMGELIIPLEKIGEIYFLCFWLH